MTESRLCSSTRVDADVVTNRRTRAVVSTAIVGSLIAVMIATIVRHHYTSDCVCSQHTPKTPNTASQASQLSHHMVDTKTDAAKRTESVKSAKESVKSGFPSLTPKAVDRNADSVSMALFLESIKALSLDDFSPLDRDESESLTLGVISTFNNIHLAPLMRSIVQMDYFRYVKLNLHRPCTLWSDISKCSLRDCSVKLCDETQLPKSLIMDEEMIIQKLTDTSGDECPSDSPQKLSQIDKTVSSDHIEAMNSLFECSEDDLEGAQYVDLILNPERFTGYTGDSAQRIWKSIYEENCFLKEQSNPFSLDSMCYEERIFYRSISGLHTSINIHLCALYHIMDGTFGHNSKEFIKRFNGQREYIKNLYILYLLELRALHKAEPILLNKVNWQSSGDQSLTKEAIKDLLRAVRRFKWHFNESALFRQQPPTVAQEFSQHFHNITTSIMDCVACDKCKLWGKLQTHGLGTAFKILLTDNVDKLKLNRHEITCLVNSLARLSNSIAQLEVFNKLLSS